MALQQNFKRVLLNCTPNSIHLHPALCNTLNVIRTKIIRHNWAISQNLGQKVRSCPFWLKIGTGGILVVLIPNLNLNFWNSDLKIQYLGKMGRKILSCPFCLKIGAHHIWRMLILIATLVFRICNPKSIFGQIWVEKF